MKKHEIEAAKRILANHWIGLLRDAFSVQLAETLRMHKESHGEPITPPLLRIHPVCGDMQDVILEALTEFVQPKRNEQPRRGYQWRIDLAYAVVDLLASGKAKSETEAFKMIGDEKGITAGVVREAYKGKPGNMARLLRAAQSLSFSIVSDEMSIQKNA